MSGGAKPTFLMPMYDAQELRRRMAVGFTIGELYRLAEKLGVPAAPSWSNSPQDASRDIVRHFERSGALPFLVEALQEAKPLIEWPAPVPPQPSAGFGAPVPPPGPGAPADAVPAPGAVGSMAAGGAVGSMAAGGAVGSMAAGGAVGLASGAGAAGATSFGAPVAAAFDGAPGASDASGDRPTPIATISAAAVFASSAARSTPPGAPSQPPGPIGFAPVIMPRPGEAPPASMPGAPMSGPGAPMSGPGAPMSAPGQGASMSAQAASVSAQAASVSAQGALVSAQGAPMSAPAPGAPVSGAPSARSAGPGRTEVDSELSAFMAAGAAPRPPGAASAQPVIQDPALSPATAWPGTVRPAGKPAPRSLPDVRLLAGGGAALLIAAVAIAFFIGRASSAAPSGEASGEPAAPAGDRVVVSQRAVEALSASLARVAHDCQIDLSTLRGRPLFQVAYHRCGPLPPQVVVPQRTSYVPDPALDPDPSDAPDPPKKSRPASGGKLQKVDTTPAPGPASGGSGCLTRCSRSHNECTSRCGAEPKQGSQYDAYQSCLGGCLKALSQCKMGCQ